MTRRRLALAAVMLVGLAYATLIQSFAANQTSHYDLLRALYSGETQIDRFKSNTQDKVRYRDHWYSVRAPGLALFALPWYAGLQAVNADEWARHSSAQRRDNEIIYLIGLWGNVLPGVLLLVLLAREAERLERGFGAATAVTLGLGTLVLPLSTLLFSHVFTAMLAFAAFAVMMRERAGPPRAWMAAAAGVLVGYGISSEYPIAFAAAVLGLYLLSRRDTLTPIGVLRRGGSYALGALVGMVPLALYNHYAFHSWTHLAYANYPRQQQGFFGIQLPSLPVLATLLFDSRGLLVLSPVLALGALGTVALYRRSRRAEALTIAGVCACYLLYNAGYYLPFGGASPGPRFVTTMLPFLALPLAIAFRRWPGPTLTLAAASVTCNVVATITHPLVGYETETATWTHRLFGGAFQPTIASAYGLGFSWGAIWPFLVAAAGAIALAALASERLSLSARQLLAGALALGAWALFAALGPTLLGLDSRGLHDILNSGDSTALAKGAYWGSYPIAALVGIASGAGALALGVAWLRGRARPPQSSVGPSTNPSLSAPRRSLASTVTSGQPSSEASATYSAS
jgi:hypothetical protein